MFLIQMVVYPLVLLTILATFRIPFIGIVGYYTLSFLRPNDLYWYAFPESRLSYYVAIATIIFAFIYYGERDKTIKRTNEFLWFFVIYLLLAFNSYINSEDKDGSYPFMLLFSKLMLMALVSMNVIENIRQVRILLVMLVISLGILGIDGNYQYFTGQIWKLSGPGQPGIVSTLDNNSFAMEFVMILPLAFFLFFTEKDKFIIRWGSVSFIPFMIHAIILTYSRGGFLGMMTVFGGCVVYLKNRKWAILAAVVIFAVTMRLQGESSKERMRTIYSYEEDPSVTSRFESWKAGINMMVQNPWSGVGIGNFNENAQIYNPVLTAPKAAHNAFLEIGGEMGIPTFTLFIIMLLMAFYRLNQIRKFYKTRMNELPHFYYATALRTALMGYVVCAMFLSLNYMELYYFLIILTGVMTNIYRRDKSEYESIVTA